MCSCREASLTAVSHLAGREDPLGLPAPLPQGHHASPLGAFHGGFAWPPPPGQHHTGGGGAAAPDNQCMFCFKSFSNRGSMTRHLRDQHLQPGATVTCDLCGKVCKNRNCLITHRSVAHSGRRRLRPPAGMLPPHWPAQDKWAGEAPPLPLNYDPHNPLLVRQEVPTDQA